MLIDNDEGFDSTSLQASYQRDYPTFMPENSTLERSIFPTQRLDLSSLTSKKSQTREKYAKTKMPSPIKADSNTELNYSIDFMTNNSRNLTNNGKSLQKSKDLTAMRKNFDSFFKKATENYKNRKGSTGSITSDRASSLSSSTSGATLGQQSIFEQVRVAQQLISEKQKARDADDEGKNAEKLGAWNETSGKDGRIDESDFHLSSLSLSHWDDSDNDTRPPSSQASLEIEQPRHFLRSSPNLVTSSDKNNQKKRGKKNAITKKHVATNSDSVRLSDSQLRSMYEQRVGPGMKQPVHSADDIIQMTRRNPSSEEDNDGDLAETIVQKVFGDFQRRKKPSEESPILKSDAHQNVSAGSLGSVLRIERARGALRSSSMSNIGAVPSVGSLTAGKMTTANRKRFDGFAPGTIRHSVSTIQVSPEKLRELRKEPYTFPTQHLQRFVIKPSTRDIFPMPLDIEALTGKMLKRDEKSTERIFGGKVIAELIHEKPREPLRSTVIRKWSGADRPTAASSSKVRELPAMKTGESLAVPVTKANFQPKKLDVVKTARIPNSGGRRPPFCSATSSDGTAYSIATVSQQLLGSVKLLHPDWLQMVRRLLNTDDTADEDVAAEFQSRLIAEKEHLEEKWKRNAGADECTEDHFSTRITVILRVLERMEELRNGAGHTSRVQQIKMIHSALLST